MSAPQAYPVTPPKPDTKCEGCDVPCRRIVAFPGRARVVVKHRLKLVRVFVSKKGERPQPGPLARLCDKCRKLNRTVPR